MESPIEEVNKLAQTLTGAVDDNIYSAEEQDKERTERQRIDNTSKFMIPHLVRPVTFGWSILMLTVTDFLIIMLTFKYTSGMERAAVLFGVSSVWSGLVGMMAKFYFQSRGDEKIEAKKALIEEKKIDAAIKIERIRVGLEVDEAKHDIREDKKDSQAERKKNRKPLFGRKKE